jgi:hypothetical protein
MIVKKKKTVCYSLTAIDMTHLGGSMGTDFTTNLWTNHYSTVKQAKTVALKDYRKRRGFSNVNIEWTSHDSEEWYSGDLSFIAYEIKPVKVAKFVKEFKQ